MLLPQLAQLQRTAAGYGGGPTGGNMLTGGAGKGLGELPAGVRLQFPLLHCTWPSSRAAGSGVAGGGNSEGMEVFSCCPSGA